MLSELLPEAKRSLYELEIKLGEVEKSNVGGYQLSDIDLGLQDFAVKLESLEKLANKESKSRKEDAKRRVQHLFKTYQHLKTSFQNLAKRKSKDGQYKSQREELFSGIDLEEFAANIDLEMAENKSIDQSSRLVDGYLQQGQETLSELVNQRERLKSAHRKLFDVLNYLGLSNKTMKSIEKRDKIDNIIVIVGICFILLLIFLLWWYFKRR
jgi:Golgi SNAP receptor complex protein 2